LEDFFKYFDILHTYFFFVQIARSATKGFTVVRRPWLCGYFNVAEIFDGVQYSLSIADFVQIIEFPNSTFGRMKAIESSRICFYT